MHGTIPIAKTYKSPSQLGFTQEEFDALAWFVEQYDAGNIPDADIPGGEIISYPGSLIKPPDAFYMPYVNAKHSCGTAGCIFGWIAHRTSHSTISSWPKPVVMLFTNTSRNVKARDARDATVRVLQDKPAW